MNIIDLIFPKKCLECGRPGKYICEDCLKKVLLGGWIKRDVYSAWKYEGVIRKAIISLKYKYATEIADELVSYLVTSLKTNYLVSGACCLVPIPLHWHRKNFRGFNQSEEVGKIVAKKMGWEFIPDLLIRHKSTVPQVQLTGLARRQNLYGVFSFNPSILVSKYPNIVLFDDVFTTGSTLYEAMKVLKGAGCKKVWGLTIAK